MYMQIKNILINNNEFIFLVLNQIHDMIHKLIDRKIDTIFIIEYKIYNVEWKRGERMK
jgi:hypothetical protein